MVFLDVLMLEGSSPPRPFELGMKYRAVVSQGSAS